MPPCGFEFGQMSDQTDSTLRRSKQHYAADRIRRDSPFRSDSTPERRKRDLKVSLEVEIRSQFGRTRLVVE